MAVPVGSLNTTMLSSMQQAALFIGALTIVNSIVFLIIWAKGMTPESFRASKNNGRTQHGKFITLLSTGPALISPFLLIANVTVTELFFHSSQAVRSEQVYAVGQWSTMVGAGLVAIGASIDRWFQKGEEQEQSGDTEQQYVQVAGKVHEVPPAAYPPQQTHAPYNYAYEVPLTTSYNGQGY